MNAMPCCRPSPAGRYGRAILLLLFAVSLLALLSCGGASDAADATGKPTASPGNAALTTADFRVRSELVFTTRADLAFEIPREVGAVNVAVGDRVSTGDVLAAIDSETITDLQYAEPQATYKLEQAQDDLDGRWAWNPRTRSSAPGRKAISPRRE